MNSLFILQFYKLTEHTIGTEIPKISVGVFPKSKAVSTTLGIIFKGILNKSIAQGAQLIVKGSNTPDADAQE